jgi:hypothetical protein
MAMSKKGWRPSIVMVARPVEGSGPNHITFDMQPKELSVIGYATLQWSYLEFMLYSRSQRLAKKARVKLPGAADDSSFSRRLRAFRELAALAEAKNPKQAAKYSSLADRIANANGIRQRMIHHVWECHPRKVGLLMTVPRDFKGRIETFDVEKIAQFADSVGAISFELAYPRGWTLRQVPTSWMSRRFLLEISGMGDSATRTGREQQ